MVQLLDLIFPRFCVGCGRLGAYICIRCKQKVHPIERLDIRCPVCEYVTLDGKTHSRCRSNYSLDGVISFFYYDKVIQKAIKELKYRFVSDVINSLLSDVEWENLRSLSNNAPVIIPIPLHPARQRYRGFNQATLIAKKLSQQLSVPVASEILIRTKKTIPQVETKTRQQRLQNMTNVFAVNPKLTIPETVLLVDDVFTTGATLTAACRVLKRAGVTSVIGVTLAR